MTKREAIKFVLIRTFGNFLLLMSLYGVFMTFGPAIYYEIQYRVIQARGVTFAVHESARAQERKSEIVHNQPERAAEPVQNVASEPSFADVLAGAKEQVLVPKNSHFSIIIPKIGASVKVTPNVDPANPDEFLPVLKEGVAHAKGTVFPGMTGNTYLFAHSANNWWEAGQYNAVFYLLKDLVKGDEVIVFFEDRRYDYVVSETFLTEPDDVSLLSGAQQHEREQLILQTCWPPGTPLKRQIVVANPKEI